MKNGSHSLSEIIHRAVDGDDAQNSERRDAEKKHRIDATHGMAEVCFDFVPNGFHAALLSGVFERTRKTGILRVGVMRNKTS